MLVISCLQTTLVIMCFQHIVLFQWPYVFTEPCFSNFIYTLIYSNNYSMLETFQPRKTHLSYHLYHAPAAQTTSFELLATWLHAPARAAVWKPHEVKTRFPQTSKRINRLKTKWTHSAISDHLNKRLYRLYDIFSIRYS